MAILANGNVGIGTSSPDTNLHIHKASAGSISAHSDAQLVVENSGVTAINLLSGASSHGLIQFGDSGDADKGVVGYDQATDLMYIRTGGSNTKYFVVNGSGNVGIGSTNPGQKLDVVGAVSASTYYGDGSNLQNVTSVAGAAGPQYSIQFNNTGTAVSGSSDLVFKSGKVGIGTNDPGVELDIQAAAGPQLRLKNTNQTNALQKPTD